ncbi:MAG: glutamate--tRNA ligase, partial [Vibrionaceae bacterium]
LQEMISLFSIDSISKSASAFNTDKLLWLNQHYMKTLAPEYVASHLQWHLDQLQIKTAGGPAVASVIALLAERCHTLAELAQQCRYFYQDFTDFDADAAKKHLRPVALPALELAQEKLAALQDWQTAALHQVIEAICQELAVGMGKVGMPLRVALTGGGQSPSVDAVMTLLGKERVLARVAKAIAFVKARAE